MKTKKIVSIISGLSILAASYAIPAYAQEITMTSNPENGAADVSCSLQEIVLTFSDLPDPGSFTADTVKLNGSTDLICDYGYDDLNDPNSMTLQLRDGALEPGETYLLTVDHAAVGDGYFSGTTRFTTDIRENQTILLDDFDTDGTLGAWGAAANRADGILTYAAEGDNNGTYLPSYADKKIDMMQLTGFKVRLKSDADTRVGFYYRTEFAAAEGEDKNLYVQVQKSDDWQEIIIPANSSMSGGHLTILRLYTNTVATLLVDSVSAVMGYSDQPVKYFYFMDNQDYFRHADQGELNWTKGEDGIHFSCGDEAGHHVFSMGIDQRAYKVGTIRFVAKKVGEKNTGLTACFWSGWYNYQYSIPAYSMELTDEFAVYDYHLDPSQTWHDGMIAQMSVLLDNANTEAVIRSIEFLPYNYNKDQYYTGSIQNVTNYGSAEERVLDADETAQNMTAILPSFWNISSQDQEIALISAAYQDGKLVGIHTSKTIVAANSVLSAPLTATVQLSEGETATVRTFLWNGQSMTPYTEKKPLN